MTALTTRPATAADASSAGFGDLLPDHWREGNNRRSLVAVDRAGRVLGHCRGIDNDFHPDSRTYVWEILEQEHLGDSSWAEVADALLGVQVGVSSLSLRLKPTAEETELIEVCARHGGILVQLMPPWRYVVDGQLRAENAPDFVPGAAGSYDPARSTVLVRARRIVAQALVWPPEEDGGVEVTVQSRPHEGSRQDMEACLAAVVERSGDGNVLLIDSHVTEDLESAMMRDLPGPPPHPGDTWTAIVGIPVAGGPGPLPLPRDLVPEDVADRFAALIR